MSTSSRHYAGTFITILICLTYALSLRAQVEDVCTSPYKHVTLDSNGILTAYKSFQQGLIRGKPWQLRNIGPDVAVTYSIVTRQGKVFVTGGGDNYRLENDSVWTRLPNSGILGFVADGAGILYGVIKVRSDSHDLYRSTDDGYTWEYRSVSKQGFGQLMASPNGDLYALLDGISGGFSISTDGGRTWKSLLDQMPDDRTLRGLHFDTNGIPIVGFAYTRLFYRDSTGTWNEPPRTIPRLHIWAVTEVPAWTGSERIGQLYACNAIGDIIRSTDRGATWELLIYGGAEYPTGIVNDLAAGKECVYVATDSGLWRLHHEALTFEQCGVISGVDESGTQQEARPLMLRP